LVIIGGFFLSQRLPEDFDFDRVAMVAHYGLFMTEVKIQTRHYCLGTLCFFLVIYFAPLKHRKT
jgi:hypothetical protein